MARRPKAEKQVTPLRLRRLIEAYSAYRPVARAAGIGASTLYGIAGGDIKPTAHQERVIESAFRDLGIPCGEMWREDFRAEFEGDQQRWESVMLSDEALSHFGLKRDPFVNELEDEADLYLDADRKAIRARLIRAVQRQHFLALVGPVGAGKTTILDDVRYWMLRQERFDVVQVTNVDRQHLTVKDVIHATIESLSTERPRNSCEARSRQARRILVESRERDRYPVIIIDEAQNLPGQTLRALKVLYDHHEPRLGFRRVMSIILSGQAEVAVAGENSRDLAAKLRSPSLDEVSARIYVVRLQAMSEKRLVEYLTWKIHRAGGSNGVIRNDAGARLAELRITTPAKIARAMPAVMQLAFDLGDKRVTAQHVERAILGAE